MTKIGELLKNKKEFETKLKARVHKELKDFK
mgnify:CR=1 FL=1